MVTFSGILWQTQTWSLANYTLLPQIVRNMFQDYLEDLGGQDWVTEEIDIKKQDFCHLWPLQISIVMVIKVWSPSNKWDNGHYIIILLILVARRTLIGGTKYFWHTRCIISVTIILSFWRLSRWFSRSWHQLAYIWA